MGKIAPYKNNASISIKQVIHNAFFLLTLGIWQKNVFKQDGKDHLTFENMLLPLGFIFYNGLQANSTSD